MPGKQPRNNKKKGGSKRVAALERPLKSEEELESTARALVEADLVEETEGVVISADAPFKSISPRSDKHEIKMCLQELVGLQAQGSCANDEEGVWYVHCRKLRSCAYTRSLGFGWGITMFWPPYNARYYTIDSIEQSDGFVPSLGAFFAVFADMLTHLKAYPKGIVIAPSCLGNFRVSQASKLAGDINAKLIKRGVPVIPAPVAELPENEPTSLFTSFALDNNNELPSSSDGLRPLWYESGRAVNSFMEMTEYGYIEKQAEESILLASWKLAGYRQSVKVGGHRGFMHNVEASVSSLRELFQACLDFHEAKPWEFFSSESVYLHMVDGDTGASFYVMLSSDIGEGLAVLDSHQDMLKCIDGLELDVPAIIIRYFPPGMTSFSAMEDIASLKLPIPWVNNDKGNDVALIPFWYATNSNSVTQEEGLVEFIKYLNERLLCHTAWPFFSKVARVVVQYVTDPNLVRDNYGVSVELEGYTVTLGQWGGRVGDPSWLGRFRLPPMT